MWANAQRDGRPSEYTWRPLFNAVGTLRRLNLTARENECNDEHARLTIDRQTERNCSLFAVRCHTQSGLQTVLQFDVDKQVSK